jgi:hypothetical protein
MSSPRLNSALEDAELLVEFAARNGIEVSSDLVECITSTRAAFLKGSLCEKEEAKFYDAYTKLAHSLGKVTVSSIRDSRPEFGTERCKYIWFGPKQRLSNAQRAVNRARWQTISGLVILLIVQIYWLWGSTLIDDLRAVESRDAELKKINLTNATDQDKANVDDEKDNLFVRFTTLDSLLRDWSSVWGVVGSSQRPNYKDMPSVYPAHILLRVPAENRLSVFQVYVLPLLYGWVGACAYVLRQLIVETRDRTYQSESRSAYDLRLLLGALSGLAVGWVLKPAPGAKLVENLTPLALSFLAGYSVEVLFSAMDKIVSAFGSVSQASKS